MDIKKARKRLIALSAAALLALTSCGGNGGEGLSSADTSEDSFSHISTEQSAVVDVPAEIAMTVKGGGDCVIDKEIEGTVVIDTDSEVKLILRGATVKGTTGPAVYVKNCGALTVMLEGESTLSDSALYSAEQGDLKGAFFSEDDVIFKGDGSLTVTGNRTHAIACDDGIVIESNVTVEKAVKDGVHANDLVEVRGGSLTVRAAGGDAVESEAEIKIEGGFIDLSSEGDGIKASLNEKGVPFIAVNGGSIKINTKEDGIQSDGNLEINSGAIDITTTGQVTLDQGDQTFPGGGTRPQRPDGGTRPERPDWGTTPPGGFDPNVSMELPEGGMAPFEAAADTSDGASSKGIKAAGSLTVKGNPTVKITTTEDAVHSDGDLTIEDGTFSISAEDDAFHAEGALAVKNGYVTVTKCYEGLEGKTVLVEDGVINITCTDDGMNSTSGDSANNRPGNANADNSITVNGGSVYIKSGGDGVDSNGALTVNGGFLCVECSAKGGDNGIDADGTRLINGGVVVALGGTDMIESPAASSKQSAAVIYATVTAGSTVALRDSKDNTVLCYTAAVTASTITVSAPELKTGETYTLYSEVTPAGEKTCGGLYYGEGVSFEGGLDILDFTQSSTVVSIKNAGKTAGDAFTGSAKFTAAILGATTAFALCKGGAGKSDEAQEN